MAVNRKAIFAALFHRLKTDLGRDGKVKTFSRRLLSWDQVDKAHQPAMMCFAMKTRPQTSNPGVPQNWILEATILIYTRHEKSASLEAELSPSEELQLDLIDRVEACLERKVDERQGDPGDFQGSLYGLVSRCNISVQGAEIYQGASGEQGEVYIQVEMLTTA